MAMTTALAAVAVADLAEAKAFYTTLFGRAPDHEPMPTLAQWDLPFGGVQVVKVGDNSGTGMLTLLVTEFDDFLAHLGDSGIQHGEVVEGVISRLTQVHDPAGNTITFAESTDAEG